MIQIIPLTLPIVKEGDDIANLICEELARKDLSLMDGDIVVIAHKIVSRSEGRTVDLSSVKPSFFAENLAKEICKDPRLVEIILRESKKIVRARKGLLIVETLHGFVCANAGVDQSNTPGHGKVTLLPVNPDASAERLRKKLFELTDKNVAVIISDTHGRPLRRGVINVAIGISGLKPLRNYAGERDLFGYVMSHTVVAVADLLSSAAALVIGQSSEAVPVAIIRGAHFLERGKGTGRDLIMPEEDDLFR